MEYPFYPELKEPAQKEAQALVDKFKEQLKKSVEEVISDFYCDVVVHIETDSWMNFRNQIMEGFKNYNNRKIQGEYDFTKIRAEIFKEFREDIISDLNQDLIKEVEELKSQLKQLSELRRHF